MKRLSVVLAAVSILALTLAGCAEADLIIDGRGRAQPVGKLVVGPDGENLIVCFGMYVSWEDYEGDNPTAWEIVATHLYVGEAKPAHHAPGRFPYKHEGADITDPKLDCYEIPLADLGVEPGETIYIAAHAELRRDTGKTDRYGNPIYVYESAWAQIGGGQDLAIGKGRNWATCFSYVIPVLPEDG